jgi:hypothetical protein
MLNVLLLGLGACVVFLFIRSWWRNTLHSFKVKHGAFTVGLVDCGDIAKDYFGLQETHPPCGSVIRVGAMKDQATGRASVYHYCWLCERKLRCISVEPAPAFIALPKPEQPKAQILQFSREKRRPKKRRASSGKNTDPPTAA